MVAADADDVSVGPMYEDNCALRVSPEICVQAEQANLAVLAAVSALDTQTGIGQSSIGSGTHDETDYRNQDLQQLDQKMNVLIQMFAGFWRQQCQLPAAIPVQVSATSVVVACDQFDVPEDSRSLALYLHEALPQALMLPLRNCVQLSIEGKAFWSLQFDELGDELHDALSRHIFRRHRRAVAQRKQILDA